MKIAAVVPLYPPNSRVGAWLATHACLAGMVARGHQVDVVTYLSAGGYAYDLDGVRVHPNCPLELVASDADVVVSHLGDDRQASTWAKAAGTPSVRMVHGIPRRHQVLDDDLAVFNSASLAEVVPHKRGVVVHPPIDLAATRTTPGDLVTLVNLAPAKGGRVFWRLACSTPGVQFLGVQGGYGHQVSDKAKNVTVIPPQLDMTSVYSRTKVLLMPSAAETWGMVGMEAMASGIPVIAHPTPGLLESLGDAGIFVDRDDLKGWRDATQTLTQSPTAWLAASAKARARADKFDTEAQLDRFAEALTSLVPVVA